MPTPRFILSPSLSLLFPGGRVGEVVGAEFVLVDDVVIGILTPSDCIYKELYIGSIVADTMSPASVMTAYYRDINILMF
jgi:hypothetical protein